VITQADTAERFLALHHAEKPLLLPNPWDRGSALVLASLGFSALATTSSGFAATLGRVDGSVTCEEALAHATLMERATELPVTADLENGFGDEPAEVARTVELAVAAGLAGCSIEDFSRRRDAPIYDLGLATERVAAAAQAAHGGSVHLVLTARADNYLHGRRDLGATIARLQAYRDAGADVLYAPGITDLEEIRELVDAVDLPVNVLALPHAPTVPELAAAGVRRISVGGAFAFVAIGAMVAAAQELGATGTYDSWAPSALGQSVARAAFDLGRPQ